LGRFFVAVQKDRGRLCDVSPWNAVTFLQPGIFVYAILSPGTGKIAE